MLEKLFEQYKQINGIDKLSIKELKNEKFRQDFVLWLNMRRQYGYRYLDFLYEINESILDRTTAEIGKTELDSIVIPFDTTIISPSKFDNLEDKDRLIQAMFMIYEDSPILYFEPIKEPRIVSIPEARIDTFMTQNPYTPYSINGWNELHDGGKFNIAVGVYGNIHDKNIESNLKMLKLLREKIVGTDYKFDYNTDGDIYYAAVASTRKIKKIGSKSL